MSDPRDSSGATGGYVLGHSDRELERLSTQARLVDPITVQFLRLAGIARGMRVLDVGSGAGDVAFLAAELVGDSGEVVGVDRSATALATARTRAEARSLRNVSFREGDPAAIPFEKPFDAVVGRYVLMFQSDPVTMLRKLANLVRREGVIVFHEPDWDGVRSFPPILTYDRCCRWIVDTMRLRGVDMRMGIKLHSTFVAAGLAAPSMGLHSVIAGSGNADDAVHFKADLAGTLVSEMERLGVATAKDVDITTLVRRIHEEMSASEGVVVGRSEIGAWSRT
jgi:SAM-dependent methyltransferase